MQEIPLREGSRLIGDLDAMLARLRNSSTHQGSAASIGFSTFPVFSAQHKRRPDVRLSVAISPAARFSRLDANELDLAILCPSPIAGIGARHPSLQRRVH
jgi:hypothetical protein